MRSMLKSTRRRANALRLILQYLLATHFNRNQHILAVLIPITIWAISSPLTILGLLHLRLLLRPFSTRIVVSNSTIT